MRARRESKERVLVTIDASVREAMRIHSDITWSLVAEAAFERKLAETTGQPKPQDAYLLALEKLWHGVRDMIDNKRLTWCDVPDDYQFLVQSMTMLKDLYTDSGRDQEREDVDYWDEVVS